MMNMNCNRTKMLALVSMIPAALTAGALALTAGCHKAPPPPPPPPPVVWQVPAGHPEQVGELAQRADDIDQTLAQLPGSTLTDHRHIVIDLLANVSKALRLAAGTQTTYAFDNRASLIDHSRAALRQQGVERPQIEAAENEAARAMLDAMDEIVAKHLSDDDQLAAMIQTVREKLDPMYSTDGPMHELVATDEFKGIGQAIRRMSDDLVERFGATKAAAK